MSAARVRDILRDNVAVSVSALASRLSVGEETVVRLLRQERAPMYMKAGALWARGRKLASPPTWKKADR